MNFKHDVVIVGSGLSGFRAAAELADHAEVALIKINEVFRCILRACCPAS